MHTVRADEQGRQPVKEQAGKTDSQEMVPVHHPMGYVPAQPAAEGNSLGKLTA